MSYKKWIKGGIWALAITFLLMNVVAVFHAYKFTHFSSDTAEKTKDPKTLTVSQKIKAIILGISNPRPVNTGKPATAFQTIRLKSNREIECWSIKADNAKGTVVLFHGYSGEKTSMLDKAEVFRRLGFNTFIVDFMGSGGSEGYQTTLGYLEAEQVKTCFDYLSMQGEKNIYLFGTSMGAVAIMKAVNSYKINPIGVIIECPFGSMYKTVCARFQIMNLPTFPMAGLLLFWGGIENGFWGNERLCDKAITILETVPVEKNTLISQFGFLIKPVNASETQALLELKTNYCAKLKCLDCAVGNALLRP